MTSTTMKAIIIADLGNQFKVHCPYCKKVHTHGYPKSGSRVPHCFPKAGEYEVEVVEE